MTKLTFSFLGILAAVAAFSHKAQAYDVCNATKYYLNTQDNARKACPGICEAYGGWNGNFSCTEDAQKTCFKQMGGPTNYGCVCGCK